MASTYVIRNQLGQYLTRKGEWVSGRDTSVLFHQPWHDQALNQLIEINAKDIELRGRVLALELDDKGRPAVLELGPDPVQPALLEDAAPVSAETVADVSADDADAVASAEEMTAENAVA